MKLHALEAGSGTALLLVHGLFDSSETWEKLIPLLSGKFKIYAIDLPGFGKTPLPEVWGESLSEMLNALIAFLDDKKITRISLLGSSMGGGLSLALAEVCPDRIEKVALLNPYALPTLPMAVHAARKPVSGHLLPYLLRKTAIRKCAEGIFARSIYDQSLVTEQMLDRVVAPFSTLKRRKALFRFLRSISPDRIKAIDERLPGIHQSVLVLWGAEDGWLSKAHWEHLKERILHSKVLHIPECGHLPQVERPSRVAEALLQFF